MYRAVLPSAKLDSGAVKLKEFHAEAQRTQRNKLPRSDFQNKMSDAGPIMFKGAVREGINLRVLCVSA